MREQLGQELHAARSACGLSLEAAGRAAQISQGYLHKLEAGRVENPSPRVLHRLSGVLDVPYRRLMELAGYLLPDDPPAAKRRAHEEEVEVPTDTDPESERPATNRALARLLEAVLHELAEVRRGQDELARALERARGA